MPYLLILLFSAILIVSAQAADCKSKFDAKAARHFASCTARAVQNPANHRLETVPLTTKILNHTCAQETKAQIKHIVAQHRCFVPGKTFGREDALEHIKFTLMGTIDNLRHAQRIP